MKNALFLHMGPGFHSEIERNLLGSQYPNVDFWNQPQQNDEEIGAYSRLLASVVEKIDSLFEEAGPIKVYAHSFGGLLIKDALEKCGDKVSSCHLISTSFYFQYCFSNVLQVLLKDTNLDASLKDEISAFLEDSNTKSEIESFWGSVLLVSKDPNYFRAYWSNKEAFQRYLQEAQTHKSIDEVTFANVSNDFLKNYKSLPLASSYKGKVTLVLGESDPLINCKEEIAAWTKVFSQIKIKVTSDAGHMYHIEQMSLEF